MKISWGTGIALLYSAFVVMIVVLVLGTALKKTDLVADDYYQQEVRFQERLDAAAASARLSGPITLHADGKQLRIVFPRELRGRRITGRVQFYAPADASADRTMLLDTESGEASLGTAGLAKTRYEVRISITVSGKDYYQALTLNTRQS